MINIANSSYSGEVLNDLISHAMVGNDTMDKKLVHIKAGIQHKYTIPVIKISNIIQDHAATPSSSEGTYTINERHLEPNDFMVYLEFNPRDYESFWRPFQPKGNLVFRTLAPKVQAKMLRLLVEKRAEYLGKALWMSTKGGGSTGLVVPSGATAMGADKDKYFDGFMKRLLESIKSDTAPEKVIVAGDTALDTGAKVEAALKAIWKNTPTQIRSKKDLKFVMGWDVFDLYDDYLTEKTFKYVDNSDTNVRKFKQKQIIPIAGIADQTIVLGEFSSKDTSNFWVGVDYSNDTEVIQVEQLQNNSEMYFFKMLMKMDTNIVKPGEIVMHSPYKNS